MPEDSSSGEHVGFDDFIKLMYFYLEEYPILQSGWAQYQ
jgi:hypothetical protein